MGTVVLISLFSVIGALLRWKLQAAFPFDVVTGWPWPTFSINLFGSFLMGVLLPFMSNSWVPLVTIGFLGSFTTFSAFSGEAVGLLHQQRWTAFSVYILGSLFGGVVLALVGYKLGKLI